MAFFCFLKKMGFKVQISENGQGGSKTYFFCKIKRRSSNITSVSKQKYSFTILKTISKLGILAVTCYPDLGEWLKLLVPNGWMQVASQFLTVLNFLITNE